MKGRIGIFFGLFAIALTIAGSAADGETTPAAEVAGPEAAAPSGPEAPTVNLRALLHTEQDASSDDSDGFKCYEYFCGPLTPVTVKDDKTGKIIDNIIDVPCEDKPPKSVPCKDKLCSRATTKGAINGKKVDVISGKCYEKSPKIHPKNGCFDAKDVCGAKCGFDKSNFTGDSESCLCSTTLCNGPSATFPSDKSSVLYPTAFVTIAALLIAVKMNI